MKIRLLLPLASTALLLCSCATQDMIAKANGQPGPLDPPNQPPTNPNPAYYALVPVVFPFDVVAWPFELIYLQNRGQGGPPPGYQVAPQQYQNAPTNYQGGPPNGAPYQSGPGYSQ